MQFIVKRDILLRSLNFVQGVVEKKNTLPILSNVLIQLKNKKLFIVATDLDIIFYDEIEDVKVINEGSTTTSAAVLYDILRKISSNSDLNFDLKSENKLSLKSESADFSLLCLPTDNFPSFSDEFEGKEITLNNSRFLKLLNKTKISISNENINLIIEKCSGDRKNLQNEMQKILNFCFEKKKITREEILKLINLYDDENYFELVDNFLAKNHKKVSRIINNNIFTKNDSIIIIRSFLSRLKRLDGLKKLSIEKGTVDQAITLFKPPIFWKEKEIVKEQINSWSKSDISILIEEVHKLEIKFKKNNNLSNNLIYDFMLNTTGITNN